MSGRPKGWRDAVGRPDPARLLGRWLRRAVGREDPGAQRSVLGLRALNAFALAGMGGLLVERGSGAAAGLILPPVAALLALYGIVFETGSTRSEAAGQICLLVGAGIAVLVGATLLLPLLTPLTPRLPGGELLLVPASFLAMYLRRHGPLGQGVGMVTFIATLYTVPFRPDLHSLPWIGLAGLFGLVAAVGVRLSGGAPEAETALLAQARTLREQIAFLLRSCRVAIHTAGRGDLERAAARRRAIRSAWSEFQNAVEGQLGPGHPSQQRLQRAVQRIYALDQATTTIAEALGVLAPLLGDLGLRDRTRLARALGRLERLALAGPSPPPGLLAAVGTAQADLKTIVIGHRGLSTSARFALVRIGFALARVRRSLEEPPVPYAAARRVTTPRPADRPGLAPTTRMAFQSATAAAVLVLFDSVAHLEHGYWAILAAALTVANSRGDTWARALERAFGTVIGVIAGLAIGPLSGHAPLLMLPAAALAVILAVVTLKTHHAVNTAAAAFAVVIALEVFLQSPLTVLLARIWETMLGVAVGMAAAAIVLPLPLTAQLGGTARAMLSRARTAAAEALAAAQSGAGLALARPGAILLAAWGAEKARYRNLGTETLLHPGGATLKPLLLARLDSLVEQTALLTDGAAALRGTAMPPQFAAVVGELARRVDDGFAAVLARLGQGAGREPAPGSDDLLPAIAAALPFDRLEPGGDTSTFEAQALVCHHARKLIQVLAEIAADLDAGPAPSGQGDIGGPGR